MSFEIGDVIGDYQVIALIGRGGMGKVFKVRNNISDRVEAMKVLLPDAGPTPELADRFIREIKVVASLEHPNIASLRTALRVQNQLLMIMELVEGASLDERLRAGRPDARQSVDVICQVLAALGYAHGRGVIHRDIKPSNILITPQGAVKLTDFGIASKAGDPRLTATGMALGSLYYMSPEQVRAMPLDARSDLYSVGVTLYETVTGRRPIQGDSFFAIMKAHLEQRPPAPIDLTPDIPPALSRIIEKSLEKAPEDRFQTADEFRSALLDLHCSAGIPSLRSEPALSSAKGQALPARNLEAVTPAAAYQPNPPAQASGAATGSGSWDAAVLEKVRGDLALFIGPMARVIVSRAAKRAQTLQELYEILAVEIPSPGDRQKFLASRPRQL